MSKFDYFKCIDCGGEIYGLSFGTERCSNRVGCLERQLASLQAIVDKLRDAELSQCGWEGDEDIVLLNGEPVGGTITRHRCEFDRWWPTVKREILNAAAEAGKDVE